MSADSGGSENKNNNEAIASERSQKMAYQKPEVVAKSEAKESFVAGCPEKTPYSAGCNSMNSYCMCGPLQ